MASAPKCYGVSPVLERWDGVHLPLDMEALATVVWSLDLQWSLRKTMEDLKRWQTTVHYIARYHKLPSRLVTSYCFWGLDALIEREVGDLLGLAAFFAQSAWDSIVWLPPFLIPRIPCERLPKSRACRCLPVCMSWCSLKRTFLFCLSLAVSHSSFKLETTSSVPQSTLAGILLPFPNRIIIE